MSLYTKLVSKIVFPAHEWLKKHTTVKKLLELQQTQWLSPQELAEIQGQKLTEFLRYIYQNNRYYKQLFDNLGIREEDFEDSKVLSRIPILDKATIRENEEDFLSDNSSNPQFVSTSGSSGTPLKFAMGNERVSHDVAAKWRATRWWGVDIGDKEAVIWGSNVELSGQGMLKLIRDKVIRSKLFPAQHLDESGLKNLFYALQKFQPRMIYGYPSILTLLGEYIKRNNLSYDGTHLKVIFCTAEKLYDHQKQTIEEVFAAPVANGYGSRDAGFIAHDCPQGYQHISSEDVITEVLNEQGDPCKPGEIGELIVTNLSTRDFPMLRYNTGDMAVLQQQPCECGRGLLGFQEVIGRANDVLTSTDGTAVHGSYIGNIIRQDKAVCHFQLVQETPKAFTLTIVCYPAQQFDEESAKQQLAEILGKEAIIQCQQVEHIAAEKTGKFKYIINRCQ